tara:strand:- start:2561 stop:2800 length:240 start_codon:yes stop_codon:yes gene_type:complete
MKKMSKLKHQVKSNKYYLFWGIATISVVVGQIYVGNGFRRMADSNDGISADINLLIENIMFAVPNQKEFIYESDPMVIR